MALKKINHGEVIFKEIPNLPKGGDVIKSGQDFIVVGESESEGNDHRVTLSEGTIVIEKDNKIYVQNTQKEKIYCPKKNRHSPIELPPNTWEISIAQEYDYIKMEKRNVKD